MNGSGVFPPEKGMMGFNYGFIWLVMGHVFHMISYVDCDVDCDMDSYMPGGGGMLTTDIEASRWSNIYIYIYIYITNA